MSMHEEIEGLHDLTVAELRERYVTVFGEPTTSRHKDYLRKRIAWRMQANAEGGLSERARRRAEELADEADLRPLAPAARTVTGRLPAAGHDHPAGGGDARQPMHRDPRLPIPGTVLVRKYRGQTITVTVLERGFEYAGQVYRSLTAVAKAITGSHWNGLLFFGLAGKAADR